ncbi:hypothetical protein DI487_03125 [Flavobacterium sediminis]|uniref:Lipoprotein n=1 Tax=Flavobacterium sediminis TaxID=2201181 RepID=A0A2U8QS20_9FLAO|nr:hypothetical protein [Flavobacterium sediminis]AWM12957.1 hypothetical protein DI487_03125 [Flavobacterium sediminis]
MKKLLYLTLLIFFFSCKNEDNTKVPFESNQTKSNDQQNNAEEKHIIKDDNGNIIEEGNLLNKQKHGVWKYYEGKNLIAVKRFYKDSLLYVLDKNDYIYNDVYLQKINSFIPVPKNWNTNTVFNDSNTLLTSVKNCDETLNYCPNIVLRFEELNSMKFEDYIRNDKDQIQKDFPNLKEVSFSKNNIIKQESYIFKYFINYQNEDIAFLIIWIKNKSKIITYTASSQKSEIEKNLYLFLQIGNSITEKEK